jgi:ribosomal protein S18 acetylase RimI-like enzyme
MVGHDGHRGWLYYVAVGADCRHRGIGRSLVHAGEKWLSQRGVAKTQLMVRETNAGVIRFYERVGYESIPRTVMHKWLKQ